MRRKSRSTPSERCFPHSGSARFRSSLGQRTSCTCRHTRACAAVTTTWRRAATCALPNTTACTSHHNRMYHSYEPDREASIYYGHNLLFLTAAYQMEGNFAGTQAATKQLAAQNAIIPELFGLCRFNRWHEILDRTAPKPSADEPMRVAIWHYARGLAYASTGDLQTAQKERQSLADLDHAMAVPGVAGW